MAECKDFAILIPLTRGLHAMIDLEDYAIVSRYKWRAMGDKTLYALDYACAGLSRSCKGIPVSVVNL